MRGFVRWVQSVKNRKEKREISSRVSNCWKKNASRTWGSRKSWAPCCPGEQQTFAMIEQLRFLVPFGNVVKEYAENLSFSLKGSSLKRIGFEWMRVSSSLR